MSLRTAQESPGFIRGEDVKILAPRESRMSGTRSPQIARVEGILRKKISHSSVAQARIFTDGPRANRSFAPLPHLASSIV